MATWVTEHHCPLGRHRNAEPNHQCRAQAPPPPMTLGSFLFLPIYAAVTPRYRHPSQRVEALAERKQQHTTTTSSLWSYPSADKTSPSSCGQLNKLIINNVKAVPCCCIPPLVLFIQTQRKKNNLNNVKICRNCC